MRVLVTAARGKTGQRVIAALQSQAGSNIAIRALSRSASEQPDVETMTGDMDDPSVRARAVAGVDLVVHYAPPMHPRETAMGTGMIDAAIAAGVKRFVYISVIHPEIDDLLNHQAKLRVEAHLINSGIEWTVLRPQHYFQNIDPRQAVATGALTMPYPPATKLGHVDMNDLADAVATVVTGSNHAFATYDIASDEHLTVTDMCAAMSAATGRSITAHEITPAAVVAFINAQHTLTTYSEEAFYRLFSYYARRGIYGNSNVLRWLLGRPPRTFAAYVDRCLAESEGPVGNG